jgi:hypothetical protein
VDGLAYRRYLSLVYAFPNWLPNWLMSRMVELSLSYDDPAGSYGFLSIPMLTNKQAPLFAAAVVGDNTTIRELFVRREASLYERIAGSIQSALHVGRISTF